jgi:hypothetical protein
MFLATYDGKEIYTKTGQKGRHRDGRVRRMRNPFVGLHSTLEFGPESGAPHIHVVWFGPPIQNKKIERKRERERDSEALLLRHMWGRALQRVGIFENEPMCGINELYGYTSEYNRRNDKRTTIRNGEVSLRSAVKEFCKYPAVDKIGKSKLIIDGYSLSVAAAVAMFNIPRHQRFGLFNGKRLVMTKEYIVEKKCKYCGSSDCKWIFSELKKIEIAEKEVKEFNERKKKLKLKEKEKG